MHFPAAELTELFRTARVGLEIEQGDPVRHGDTLLPSLLIGKWKPANDSVGHVVLGTKCPDSRYPDIAGQLLDLKTRGVAIVYTKSPSLMFPTPGMLLQTTAHEIGHLLNLGHEDVTVRFTSAMEQATSRTKPTRTQWDDAARDAGEDAKRGNDPYFEPPLSALACYPFAILARRKLNTQPDADFLPWGGAFKPNYPSGADDTPGRQSSPFPTLEA